MSYRIWSLSSRTIGIFSNSSYPRLPPRSPAVRCRSSCGTEKGGDDLVAPKKEVIRFIKESLCKYGAPEEHADIVAEHLFVADYRGHFSHGMNRMQMYAMDIEKKTTDAKAKPTVVKDFQAIALVDGRNGMGQVIGKFCMELAIKKAKAFGIGMVAAKGSNHYGIAGYYSLMAVEEGLIGFSCTNTSPLMAPTGAKVAGLGTNPLSLAAGCGEEDVFVLDMATTAVALGKIELAQRKGESIPKGWAQDPEGKVTTDAKVAFDTACLMPLGGPLENSGYKGYGLALMVEVLSGILSGGSFGPNIRSWKGERRVANLGHCFMAIDPNQFDCGFTDRLTCLLNQLRELPAMGKTAVMVAGDPEKKAMRKTDEDGGLTYHKNQLKASEDFAKKLGIEPMKLIPKKTRR